MTDILEINNNGRYEVCPVCKSEQIGLKYNLHYANPLFYSTKQITLTQQPELYSCLNCESCFTQNFIPEEISYTLYADSNSIERWEAKDFVADKTPKTLAILNKYIYEGKSVLDIGCNYALFLDFAKSLGATTSGVEYSKASAKVITQKGHQYFESFNQVNQTYDVITAFDLIEHVYDLDAFFANAERCLNNKGFLIIFTGDPDCLGHTLAKQNWWYTNFPEHVKFISGKYYSKLISGFNLEQSINVFNNKNFKNLNYSFWDVLTLKKLFFKRKNQLPYNGLPSLLPDHHLVVLRKK